MSAKLAHPAAASLFEDWVFGYGSIISNLSRRATTAEINGAQPPGAGAPEDAILARLEASFGFVRSWNFRSLTGFTAVGLRPAEDADGPVGSAARRTCGVLFQPGAAMDAFDLREVGYERRRVELAHLSLCDDIVDAAATAAAPSPAARRLLALLRGEPEDAGDGAVEVRVWAYVNLPLQANFATEQYPICQTYVDTVLAGCLAWGGRNLAAEWVASTHDWSPYWLNDAPLSRRPWLHRGPQFRDVDAVLGDYASWTRFAERRHPEDFAAVWMAGTLRGLWGVPSRNPNFVGREREIRRIREAFVRAGREGDGTAGVATLEAVGLGGVGKTQIAVEYCHRHYQSSVADAPGAAVPALETRSRTVGGDDGTGPWPSATIPYDAPKYGLVVWLNAESPDSIAAGLRDLAADSGVEIRDMKNEEVFEKIRGRLWRTQCSWLLVLDNVVRMEAVADFVPKGGQGGAGGHVLVTTRRNEGDDVVGGGGGGGDSGDSHLAGRRIAIDCFSEMESVDFLYRVLGESAMDRAEADEHARLSGAKNLISSEPAGSVGAQLAHAVGHLPLALAVAGAYMLRCDVSCAEYLRMLQTSNLAGSGGQSAHKLAGYPMGLTESLRLSLRRLAEEEDAEVERQDIRCQAVLDALCFFAPDGISKAVVRALVERLKMRSVGRASGASAVAVRVWQEHPDKLFAGLGIAASGAALLIASRRFHARTGLFGASAIASLAAAAVASRCATPQRFPLLQTPAPAGPALGAAASHAFAATDRIWRLLKQFSLLSVSLSERSGSMHRLLRQLLREMQPEPQQLESLVVCVQTLEQLWRFDAHDSATWADTGRLLEHVKCVGHHAMLLAGGGSATGSVYGSASARTIFQPAARLLTEAALYLSMALSQFEEADAVLLTALQLNGVNKSHAKSWSSLADADADVARALHTRGQVARYRGHLAEASAGLNAALQLRRELLARASESRCAAAVPATSHTRDALALDVASSLHELGVLRLKQQDLPTATALLNEALDMKQRLPNRSARDEASTLHQLAVAAMSEKPRPRLDRAEQLLKQALRLGADRDVADTTAKRNSARSGSSSARAASLVQLARVELRRGRHLESRQHLTEALALHRASYGEKTPHVNVVAVLMQLGKVACAMGAREQKKLGEGAVASDGGSAFFDESEARVQEALRLQREIYGPAADHVDIASTLGQLGLTHRAARDLDRSATYFRRQKEMLLRLLPRTAAEQIENLIESGTVLDISGLPLRRHESARVTMIVAALRGLATVGQPLQQLVSVLEWERVLAREGRDATQSKRLGEAVKTLLAVMAEVGRQDHEDKEDVFNCCDGSGGLNVDGDLAAPVLPVENGSSLDAVLATPLCRLALRSREELRAVLVKARKARASPAAPAGSTFDPATAIRSAVKAIVHSLRAELRNNHEAETTDFAAVGDSSAQLVADPRAIVRSFLASLEKLSGEETLCETKCFTACDKLRSDMRELGVPM